MLLESLVAWCWTPLLLAVSCGAVGLLVERAVSMRIPTGLLVAVGFSGVILVSTLIYTLGGHTPVILVVVALLGAAGIWVGRRDLRGRLVPGPAAGAALLTYGLYLLPVLATGGWTWTGYNFVNDTSVHFLLIDYLSQHGTDPVTGPASNAATVQSYVTGATYPIGGHAPLAAALALIPAPLEATYVPYMAFAMALAAYAFFVLLRLAGLPERFAAAGAVVAAGANLTYQYALQGNFKEVVVLALVATAAALIGVFVADGARAARGVVAPVLCAIAAVPVFSAGALAYVGGLAAALVLALLLSPKVLDLRRLGRAAAIGAGVVVLAMLPLVGQVTAFAKDAAVRFSDTSDGGTVFDTTAVLGHLLRPLDPGQLAGIWLRGDYRLPAAGILAVPTTVLIAVVVVLAVAGVAFELRRRRPATLLLALPVLLVALVLGTITTPYIDGKLYAIASPAVLLLAGVAVYALSQRFGRVGQVSAAALAMVVAAGVFLSMAFAYHDVKLAPVERFEELGAVGDRLTGGPWLVNEWEEFGKYYLRDREVNVPNENVLAPQPARYRRSLLVQGRWFDLDTFELEYVESFPRLLTRRSPAESRPPADFERIFATENYEAWKAVDGPTVVEHLPIGNRTSAAAVPSCSVVRRFAARVEEGERLVAAVAPEAVALDVHRKAPPQWPRTGGSQSLDVDPLTVVPKGAADLTQRLEVAGGRYEIWVRGTFSRPVAVSVDGREVGEAVGVDGPGQWHPVAEVQLDAGVHPVRLQRPGPGFAPGDGSEGVLGPVVLQRATPTRIVEIDPSDPGTACGMRLDWLERVRGSGSGAPTAKFGAWPSIPTTLRSAPTALG
jgi:hypothetical protein